MPTEKEINQQIEILAETGRKIVNCFTFFGSQTDFKPAPNKWSARQILQHLTDSEIVLAYRLRTVLANHQPKLMAFDQDAWSATLAPEVEGLALMAASFNANRNLTVILLKGIPAELWERKGLHEEAGEMSTFDLVVRNTKHCLSHLAQLEKFMEMSQAVPT